MSFCIINDFPGYGNLLGYKVKGAKSCPIYLEDTCSHWMKETKKTVFRAPSISSLSTSYRKKTVEFNGKVENGNAPMELMRLEIYDKVKNMQVEFGKWKKEKGKREKKMKKFGRRNRYYGISLIGVNWTLETVWMGCISLRTYARVCLVCY
jgi:Transposase family tnp2